MLYQCQNVRPIKAVERGREHAFKSDFPSPESFAPSMFFHKEIEHRTLPFFFFEKCRWIKIPRSDPGIQKFEIWTPQRRQDLGPPTPDSPESPTGGGGSGFDTISIQFNSSIQFHISVSGLQYIYALHTICYGEEKNTPFLVFLFSFRSLT